MRAFAVDVTTLRCSTCWPLQMFFVGAPFYGVSFRAFTVSANAEKGTPTAQLFDNRSIA